ncbi:MAG TPA: ATP-grasp domain-containing protein [archaeon]|nr:ATP-grasp domain-containing protein [archaeon]
MKIGILSKRKKMLAGKLKEYFENKNWEVKIYTHNNLNINVSLLENDFFILKSKKLFFLYAAYYIEANNIPVIPNPNLSYMQKNRIESHFLIKRAGLNAPEIFMGTPETMKKSLQARDFPLILKPIMSSGSHGILKINNVEDINFDQNQILYLEKYIIGEHYLVYFIGNEICTLIKPPLSNEHVDMEKISTPDDIKKAIVKWRKYLNGDALFGHLDMVKEKGTNKLYIVDPGSFPAFSKWKYESSYISKIGELILNKFEKLKVKI